MRPPLLDPGDRGQAGGERDAEPQPCDLCGLSYGELGRATFRTCEGRRLCGRCWDNLAIAMLALADGDRLRSGARGWRAVLRAVRDRLAPEPPSACWARAVLAQVAGRSRRGA